MIGKPPSRPRAPLPDALPQLPLHDAVVFPLTVVPLAIGQPGSVRLVEDAMRADRMLSLATRRPGAETEVYPVGTAGVIRQLFRTEDGVLRIVVQGLERVRFLERVREEPYAVVRLQGAPETDLRGTEAEGLTRAAADTFIRLLESEQAAQIAGVLESLSEPREVAYQIAAVAPIDAAERQRILEMDSVTAKLRRLLELLQHEAVVREVQKQVTRETRQGIDKQQREYVLREQLKTIQRELDEAEGAEGSELQRLRRRLESIPTPQEVRREVERELGRLAHIPDISPEYGQVRTWLEWIADLPWSKPQRAPIDVKRAREVLDADHYDLDAVKDRILEYLSVMKLRQERAAELGLAAGDVGNLTSAAPVPQAQAGRSEPLLCFVGPPGVGKTSLGQSIARALGRRFIRISLGGIHDESEIRGHRRTYIGAMPGRIIQALRRSEASDPVFMLDEVDKLGVGFQGDPAAALLEVLDPAQNSAFVDTYLGVPFDLSRVLFICTANTVETIPAPLLDRTEMLALPGYTEAEKLQIARRYLVARGLSASGLREDELRIEDEALRAIIRGFTREAGVRNLERAIAAVARKAARRIAEGERPPIRVQAGELQALLGPPRFFNEVAERIDRPGIATGLAWTPMGGEILFVEATMMAAQSERLILTGMLGDVMRESATAALSYVRSNWALFGVPSRAFQGKTVHIHVPAGAIRKDGPSAGVAMSVALVSLANGRVVRTDVGMTGEISLRGKVLPVGGVKEKVIAAHQAGLRRVILPRRNLADLEGVPEEVRRQLQFIPVDSVEDAIDEALESQEKPAGIPLEPPPPIH